MEDFNKSVWNRLYYQGEYIAAELPSSQENYRRWVAIYKSKPEHPLSPWEESVYKYSVLDFELDSNLVDEYFSEEDKLNQRIFYADSEVTLLDILHKQNIAPSLFTYPWKCDYPL